MNSLVPVKVQELDEILYLVRNASPRYLEGEEFVLVKRTLEDREPKYIRKKSLVFHWK